MARAQLVARERALASIAANLWIAVPPRTTNSITRAVRRRPACCGSKGRADGRKWTWVNLGGQATLIWMDEGSVYAAAAFAWGWWCPVNATPQQRNRVNVQRSERSDSPQGRILHGGRTRATGEPRRTDCVRGAPARSALRGPPHSSVLKFLRPFDRTGHSPDCPGHLRRFVCAPRPASDCRSH
jgi:hypothetical protein